MENKKFFYKSSFTLNHNGRGFTLVEVLLVVAIFAILLASAVSVLNRRVFVSDINTKSRELVDIVGRARDYAMSGYRGDVWGIKVLDNNAVCPSSADCLVLYKGSVFNNRDESYDQFVSLDTGQTSAYLEASQVNEFYFGYNNGWLATTTGSLSEQSIIIKTNTGEERTIRIAPTGLAYIFNCGEDSVYDNEGNAYQTVKIASQCWMAENLNIGTMLATAATTPSDNSSIEKWCYDNNAANCGIKGGLYDWDELMAYSTTAGVQGICPAGWHVPTDAQWDTLEANYPVASAGTDLKLNGQSDFGIVMAGELNGPGDSFDSLTTLGIFWTSTVNGDSEAYSHYVSNTDTGMNQASKVQTWGLAIRCLKDA